MKTPLIVGGAALLALFLGVGIGASSVEPEIVTKTVTVYEDVMVEVPVPGPTVTVEVPGPTVYVNQTPQVCIDAIYETNALSLATSNLLGIYLDGGVPTDADFDAFVEAMGSESSLDTTYAKVDECLATIGGI